MNYIKNLFLFFKLTLAVLWPTTIYAAQMTLGENLAAIPPSSILITMLLSTLSGLTSLLNRLKKEYEEHGDVKNIRLFIASNLMGSNLAGLLAFLATSHMNTDVTLQAGAIILAAFGGVWVIEKVVVSLTEKFFPEPEQQRIVIEVKNNDVKVTSENGGRADGHS